MKELINFMFHEIEMRIFKPIYLNLNNVAMYENVPKWDEHPKNR